jgi:hypothetical protein
MRGNSSLEGAADTTISLHRMNHGPIVRIRCEKQKDAIEFDDLAGSLTDVARGAVLVPCETPNEERELSGNDRLLLSCLRQEGMTTREWREASELKDKNSSYNKSRNRLLAAGKVSYDPASKKFAPADPNSLLTLAERGGDA